MDVHPLIVPAPLQPPLPKAVLGRPTNHNISSMEGMKSEWCRLASHTYSLPSDPRYVKISGKLVWTHAMIATSSKRCSHRAHSNDWWLGRNLGGIFHMGETSTRSRGPAHGPLLKAIDQFGNDNTEVRLGGIHALERIARDSPTDRLAIVSVLSAFIHHQHPWPPSEDHESQLQGDTATEGGRILDLRVRAPSVHAALSVLHTDNDQSTPGIRLSLTMFGERVLRGLI
jgi:hypothetical protein